jgi:hypothetical protein
VSTIAQEYDDNDEPEYRKHVGRRNNHNSSDKIDVVPNYSSRDANNDSPSQRVSTKPTNIEPNK